jgi:hypothetical protein
VDDVQRIQDPDCVRGVQQRLLGRPYKIASIERQSTLINGQGVREFTAAYVNPEPSIGGVAH